MRETVKQLFRNFVMIYGFTMLATLVFCTITGNNVSLGLDYFRAIIWFSLAADLTVLVYLPFGKVSAKGSWILAVLHTVVLSGVLLCLGYYIGMWNGVVGGILFWFMILIVDFLVRFFNYREDVADASAINKSIQKRRER